MSMEEGWKKSSFCADASCVEVMKTDAGVWVQNPEGGSMIGFTFEEWRAFVQGVKAGEFDV